MKHPLKESFLFYTRHIESMLLISAVVVLPFLLIHNYAVNTINFMASFTGAKIVSGYFNLFLLLLFITIVQLPFAQFVQNHLDGEERPVRQALGSFLDNGFSLFVFSVVYVLAVSTGMLLFLVPGLVILVLFYLTPYLMVIKKQPVKESWKKAFGVGKKHFFPILGVILLASVVEWIIGLIGLYTVTYITTSFGAVLFTQILLNVIIFPLIAVIFTMYTHKWMDESKSAESEPLEG
ncbi:hypothetical protein [Brevibacillus brevis]|uniref:Glycerophosphoryl diester phosphodiesterase membrane domain-containing protein n=1 Tax=Brevibacillus brevis TaxID=1393 RepID=A0ABY9T629_BREBE|nr:hypothetical protein [Brevibacillus brevis]WNC15540.1 hypothetical protein RGB73_04145 [Brevibacillus brevis]